MPSQKLLQEKGLSSIEAKKSFSSIGSNEILLEKNNTFIKIFLEILKEPMFILLILAATLYLLLGDFQEGVMLLGFVVITIGFTLFQEYKAEKAITALRNLSSPRSLVLRDGIAKRISSIEIVPEDIIFLSEGDRIPADGVLISENEFVVDESTLTGESVSVHKEKIGDKLPVVYSSTLVVKGHGKVRINKTGKNSEIGKIGQALKTISFEKSTLSIQTSKLVTQISFLSFGLSFLLFLIYGITHGDWLQATLSAIALAMAILPQEYVVIMTIFPALGAWRLSKINVLTRRLSSIETLGAVSVLCVDKTGTITKNQMNVASLYTNAGYKLNYKSEKLPEAYHLLIEISILASAEDPYDPMEKAFHDFGDTHLADTEHIHKDWKLIREYGLTSELKAMSHVWKTKDLEEFTVAAKGSPEAIIELCHLNESERELIEEQVNVMASAGLRVLGFAQATPQEKDKNLSWPDSEHDFNFNFVGLIGLSDPLREEVKESVQKCHQAGIKLVMITGDYPITALTIAKEIGLGSAEILTGEVISKMADEELQKKLKTSNVCARITPEQKLRIIQALKANGEITAMTGDGVNDAPALKAAHVGIAMGARGTDVAREAASIILLDDNFTSIVGAIQLGRRIFDNIQKSMSYVLTIHIPIAGMALLPLLFKLPPLLYPMHIAFLELIIDPACSLAFENELEEKNIMDRPPRDTNSKLMDNTTLTTSMLNGFIAAIIMMVSYSWGLKHLTEKEARTFTFIILVVTNIGLLFSSRTRSKNFLLQLKTKNLIMWGVSLLSVFFLALIIYLPFLCQVFRFAPLSLLSNLVAVSIGMISIIIFSLTKIIKAP